MCTRCTCTADFGDFTDAGLQNAVSVNSEPTIPQEHVQSTWPAAFYVLLTVHAWDECLGLLGINWGIQNRSLSCGSMCNRFDFRKQYPLYDAGCGEGGRMGLVSTYNYSSIDEHGRGQQQPPS